MALRRIPFAGIVLGLAGLAGHAFAQQPAPKPGPKNPVEAAQQAAKTAAQFESLGALVALCRMAQLQVASRLEGLGEEALE